jgi:hypothetical protein
MFEGFPAAMRLFVEQQAAITSGSQEISLTGVLDDNFAGTAGNIVKGDHPLLEWRRGLRLFLFFVGLFTAGFGHS